MGRGAKKILAGKSSSVFLLDLGVFKKAEETPWGKEILEDRGLSSGHSEKAEILADSLLDILGQNYQNIFARLQKASLNDLGEGLLVEYIKGDSLGESISRARKKARDEDNWDYLERQKSAVFCPENISKKDWLRALRRIVFIDTVLANSDRHLGNIMSSPSGPVGIDQGLSFTPEKGFWQMKETPMNPSFDSDLVVFKTGGTSLLEEEKKALENIMASDWLKRVQETFGENTAREAKARILSMLESGKIYPLITGFGISKETDRFQRKMTAYQKFSKSSS